MLMLLKPWRDLQVDLKSGDETWEAAFDAFFSAPSTRSKRLTDILCGIQYFHHCSSAADADRDVDDGSYREGQARQHTIMEDGDLELSEAVDIPETDYTEEGLDNLVASQVPVGEYLHGRMAVELGLHAKVFHPQDERWVVAQAERKAAAATGDDVTRLIQWQSQMEADVAQQNGHFATPPIAEPSMDVSGASVIAMETTPNAIQPGVLPLATTGVQAELSLSAVDPSELRSDQRRAYDIVAWHLEQTLGDKKPPPLRMILQGEGGTGKSKVIQTIKKTFEARAASNILLKSVFTGVAALLIDGKTTHVIAGISLYGGDEPKLTDEAKGRLQDFWRNIQYLIIDEFSMLAKTFFALLSRNISIAKQGSPHYVDGASFGGINIIICGDFHQFPPVAKPIREALYYPIDPIRDTASSQLGRAVYEEFSTVVTLKEQMRVSDPEWLDFLRHLRAGHVQEHHLVMLRKLIVGHPSTPLPDFTAEPWSNASLVTPRHAVRNEWNSAAIRTMCRERGRQLLICTAEDTVKGRPLTLREKYAFESRHLRQGKRQRRKKDLPRRIKLAIGMKVMVTENIETDLDLTNGARGEITDIILHPDEPAIGDGPIVHLQHLPLYILVKLHRTRATAPGGLDECVIPVIPASTSYRMKIETHHGKTIQRTIDRRQFPMTAAYAFTDYRSQGQTLPYVLIDIASPPTGSLTLFNLYVALSRSAGKHSIRILRDFDDRLFKASHDAALLSEDDRIEEMDRSTKDWYNRMFH